MEWVTRKKRNLCTLFPSGFILAGLFFLSLQPQKSIVEEKIVLSGIKEPVEISRDRWGIPHIFALNENDLFFAQGFMAAADRLFQLELWRRQATGTLSAAFGRRFLQADIGHRLLRFRGDLERELNFYHPRGKEIILSFVNGINAYINYIKEKPALLPDEFRWLGLEPGLWTPEIVISRHNGLYRNATDEIALAQSVYLLGAKKVEELLPFRPRKPDLSKEIHIDLAKINNQILELYRASRTEINFLPSDIIDSEIRKESPTRLSQFQAITFSSTFSLLGREKFCLFRTSPLIIPGQQKKEAFPFTPSYPLLPSNNFSSDLNLSIPFRIEPASDYLCPFSSFGFDPGGSNNWVLSGSKTISGKPYLANDPHRALQLPSLRTWVHLVGPGWNVIGGGEPALPGVSIGHNESGAWGLTIFATDQEDIYVYQLNPENHLEYFYSGQWEKLKILREKIEIKGESPMEIELKFTRHGPVLYEDEKNHLLYALRAAWLEVGAAPYLASLRLDQAHSWQEFREACRYFRTPSENLIWADRAGNIGWQAVGLAPLRKNFSGLLPVPGDGRFEWAGFIDPFDLPHKFNPEEDFIATANECNLPPDFPYSPGFLWAEPFRAQRIREFLSSKDRFELKDMVSLQQDVLSLPARELISLLKFFHPEKENLKMARSWLLAWDYRLRPESPEAALYATWQRALVEQVWQRLLPEFSRRFFPRRSLELTLNLLLKPSEEYFGAEPEKVRDEIILSSLERAMVELQNRFGGGPETWVYGHEKFHHVLLTHPLSPAVKSQWRFRLDLGPLPRGGDANTVCATSGFYRQTSGATFRLIADLSNWDSSLGTNCPGQSGDYRSPHYADLFLDWAEGKYFPIFYTRAKIMEVAEKIIRLLPGNKKTSSPLNF